MKVGDLVKIKACASVDPGDELDFPCECFFCSGSSNRIGLILSPAPMNSWAVMFDCGQWRLDKFDFAHGDAEVVSESR